MAHIQETGLSAPAEASLAAPRSVIVLYGSETGNSQEIAEELAVMFQRLRFQTQVDEMNAFELRDIVRHSLAVFVTSTMGQGDMPKSAAAFWKKLLRKKLPPGCLSRVRFTIFGLGDSSYPKFNWAARKLHKRLLQLGAAEFFAPGEGDERHEDGIDSIYLPWSQDLKQHLLAHHPLPNSEQPIPEDTALPPRFVLRLATKMAETDHRGAHTASSADQDRQWQEVRHLNAAVSHIEHPMSQGEQDDDQQSRHRSRSIPTARQSHIYEDSLPKGVRIDTLDKDNILKDHPSKYLLESLPQNVPRRPADILLPIPDSYIAEVEENIRLTPQDHWQDTRKITLRVNIGDKNVLPPVIAGTTATIYPKNYPDDVQQLIDLFRWEHIADKPVEWITALPTWEADDLQTTAKLSIPNSKPRGLHANPGTTLRELLENNFDITAIPKRSFLRQLSAYATDAREKEKLNDLTKQGNNEEYYDYAARPRRTILEVLRDFPSLAVPWEHALDLFPIIRGREFSVANGGGSAKSGEKDEIVLELVVALLEYKTIIRKPREGLCSRYLKHLPVGAFIRIGIDAQRVGPIPDRMHLTRPVVAIATGTGIAPIRSLVQDREYVRRHGLAQDLGEMGPTVIFFGCRNERADYYFRDEWEAFAPAVATVPAFSRDPVSDADRADGTFDPYGSEWTHRQRSEEAGLKPKDAFTLGPAFDYDRGKNYVQHHIRKHAAAVCDMLRRDAIVLVCGNAGRMPKSVRLALQDAMVLGGIAKDSEEAEGIFSRLNFWQETW